MLELLLGGHEVLCPLRGLDLEVEVVLVVVLTVEDGMLHVHGHGLISNVTILLRHKLVIQSRGYMPEQRHDASG